MVDDPYLPLFAYGTLRDLETLTSIIGSTAIRRAPATARGRLEDHATTYPTATFSDLQGKIVGELLWLPPDSFRISLQSLDRYEGVPGLFRRIRVKVSSAGSELDAYAYEWANVEY
jgi:gamma-glutamylcyclotransferase (GGCT)/AIG2-like uncharacterized protein YtfP